MAASRGTTAIGGLVAGRLTFQLITRWGRIHWSKLDKAENLKRSDKLAIVLLRAGFMLFSVIVAMLVAFLVAIIFDTEHEPSRRTIFIIVSTFIVYRILRVVIAWNFFAPDHPMHRFVNLNDVEAKRLFRDWAFALMAVAIIIGTARFVGSLNMNDDFATVVRITALLICALIFACGAIWRRAEVVNVLLGQGDLAEKPQWLKVVAFSALPVILTYLATAWFISSVRLTLGYPGGFLPLAAPFIVFIVAVFAYAASLLVLDRFYEGGEGRFRTRELNRIRAERRAWHRALKARELAEGMSEAQREILDENEEMTARIIDRPTFRVQKYNPIFKSFFEQVIQAIIVVVSLGELSRLWGFDVGREGGHPIASTLDAALIVYIAVALYRSVNHYIDTKIVAEGGRLDGDISMPGESDSEGGIGESRVATLLPIFRNVLTITIAAIAVVSVLSFMGVNVGPLFAGAGVVGIAIGFGAQTLIRDIFSGAFFLMDDAFRKGEYIEIDQIRGVVEKISMRSFQLRHHLGAVHTIPFGEIKQLTNFSRDWVMMKLPMRVTYDTDVEKVRKLVKKLGQELLKDKVVGPLFLQPLKSQGVYKMEDSAMIIRVKFMTRPGDQFVTRKVVFAAVRNLFEREGIQFAHREVTVHIADEKKAAKLTPAQRKAITGSVQAAIEEEEVPLPKEQTAGGAR